MSQQTGTPPPPTKPGADEKEIVELAFVRPALGQEQIDLLKRTYFSNAPDEVVALALHLCRRYGLDPLAREVMLVERSENKLDQKTGAWEKVKTWQPMVGRDGFLAIAHQDPHFDGMSSGVVRNKDGKITEAWAEVYRKDWTHPLREEVTFEEYAEKKKDGTLTRMWASKPGTMLKKVAESQALRKAFRIHGVYSPEEMPDDREEQTAKPALPPASPAKPLAPAAPTKANGQAMNADWTPAPPAAPAAHADPVDGNRKLTEEERKDFVKKVTGMGFSADEGRQLVWERAVISTTQMLTLKQAEEILDYLATNGVEKVLAEIRDHLNIKKQEAEAAGK